MTHVLLDADALLQHPEILAIRRPDHRYVITSEVMNELLRRTTLAPNGFAILKLIEEGISKGYLHLLPQGPDRTLESDTSSLYDIINVASTFVARNDSAMIVSDNRQVAELASARNVNTVTALQFITGSNGAQRDPDYYDAAIKAI